MKKSKENIVDSEINVVSELFAHTIENGKPKVNLAKNVTLLPEILQEISKYAAAKRRITDALNTIAVVRNNWDIIQNNPNLYFGEFMKAYQTYYQDFIHNGITPEFVPISKLPLHNETMDFNYVYLGAGFMNDVEWSPRFENKFIQKVMEISRLSNDHGLLCYLVVKLLCKGNFFISGSKFNSEPVQSQTIPYMQFFSLQIFPGTKILFVVNLEKIPEFNQKKNQLIKFSYVHTIRFFNIISGKQNQVDIVNAYFKKLLQDPSTNDIVSKVLIPKKKNWKESYLFFVDQNNFGTEIISFNNFSQESQSDSGRFFPNEFETEYLSKEESASFFFDKNLGRWVTNENEFEIQRNEINNYQKQVNKEILNKFADFKSASYLVDLIEKIPQFKIKLTDEEKDAVGENENVLVIGRSGTGKTTCAVLRLFAIELLYKLRLTLYQMKHNELLKDTRFGAEHIDSTVGLHCVFVTASPVLTNEVQRYYERISSHVKNQLKKKERAQQAATNNESLEMIMNESKS